jgi:hypothetical protein
MQLAVASTCIDSVGMRTDDNNTIRREQQSSGVLDKDRSWNIHATKQQRGTHDKNHGRSKVGSEPVMRTALNNGGCCYEKVEVYKPM